MVIAHLGGSLQGFAEEIAAFGGSWTYVAVPFLVVPAATVAIARAGRPRTRPRTLWRQVDAVGAGLERLTGLPAWCGAGLGLGLGALPVLVIGFFWDVAWHVDLGRDRFLFSPPHAALALGLALIGAAGVSAILYATRSGAAVGWGLGPLRIPYGAAGMAALGAAAVAGFAVDELWHWAYGLDVTLWSPPHLIMVASGSLSPLFAWTLLAEAGPRAGRPAVRRAVLGLLASVLLIAASAWQLEFDIGVPQWSQWYHPLLIAVAAGFSLVTARVVLGRGGALVAVGGFLIVRTLLLGLITGLLGLTQPRFPLYLVEALLVEAVFARAGTRLPRMAAVLAGAVAGSLGLVAAAAWTHQWGYHPWQPGLWPAAAIALPAAVAAAVLGLKVGASLAGRAANVGGVLTTAAFAVLVLALAAPGPRTVPQGAITVFTSDRGDGTAMVAVQLDPTTLAEGADRWEVLSWQGGSTRHARLRSQGGGRYTAETPVPVTGNWKSVVRLTKGSRLGAAPVFLPTDPAIGASAVPVAARRTGPLLSDSLLLLREAHDGPRWPGLVGYGYLAAQVIGAIALLGVSLARLERSRRRPSPQEGTSPPISGPGALSGSLNRR